MRHLDHSQDQPPSIRRRVLSLPTLLSFGIAAALIVFLATRLDLDWSATWDNVRNMNPWLFVLGFLLYYMSFGFRGLRWRILASNAEVQSSSGGGLPPAFQFSQLIIIGWFVNAITWLRMGDAYRAYALSEESGGRFSWSLGTVLAERVLDMATVVGILVISAIFLTTATDSSAADYVVVAALIMAVALVAMMFVMKTYGARLAGRLPGRLEAAYHRFHQGTLGSFKRLPLLLFLGLIGWTLEIARLYFVIEALDMDIGLALIPIAALGGAILSTVPTPGGVGAVEPGVTGLLVLSLDRHDALSVVLVDRSITYLSIIVIGGLVFSIRQVARARRGRYQASEAQGVGRHENVAGA